MALTKHEIKIYRDIIRVKQNQLAELEKKLSNVSTCEECNEESDDCNMVLWYENKNKTTFINRLNTCQECQEKYKDYIA